LLPHLYRVKTKRNREMNWDKFVQLIQDLNEKTTFDKSNNKKSWWFVALL